MTWNEIEASYDADQDANFEGDWDVAQDVYDDGWHGHADLAKLSKDELLKAMKAAAGCGCCTSGVASTLGDSIWAEIAKRLT